jgi:serine/threonine protein kinase/tetratricopeptide (TPR) repeat protein
MDPEQPKDEESLYHAATAKPVAERAVYLREVCPDDPALLARVMTLLQSRAELGDFLEAPPLGEDVTLGDSLVAEGPGTTIGRYKLLERIGEGGMAVVYMAEQTEPIRRRVALKIIKLGMDTRQVIARFEAERQALALMDHPSIAKVFDAGATDTGRPYFVMELVQGVSITEYCDANSLSTKDRLRLFLQVCQAVQHAHTKGIIHRDLKPSNVMVTHQDGQPVPKVIDFGIAKATNQRLTEKTLFTRYAHLIGTPAYMSPEQAELSDLDIDTRSDIYSLGVLLYELLTGTTPFSEEELRKASYLEMQRVIREQEPVKPSTRIKTALRTASVPLACKRSWRGRLALACRGHPARATSWHRHPPPARGQARADETWAGSPCHQEQGQACPERSRRDALATESTGETPVVLMGGTPMLREVRGDLDWIVMKSLEKDRARRYETASGLAEDIRRHLDHEPVLARGPGAAYRLGKFLRRHRSQVLGLWAATGVTLAGLVVLSLWNRDRQQLAEAQSFRDRGVLSQARERYAKAERDAALETLKPVLQSPHVGPEAQLLQAGILVDNRRSDAAVTILKGLLGKPPEIAGAAHALLARILWESESLDAERLKEVEEHRRQAEALLPETAEAYFLRAVTAITVKEQLAALDRALGLEPGHYESLRLRAFTYYASRKYEKMKDDALGMTYLRPGDPLGHSLRATAWRELGRYPEAIAGYDRALALTPRDDPKFLDLAAQRCETLLRTGNYERARSEADAYLQSASDKAAFRHCLFGALTALGDYDQAKTLFREITSAGQGARRQFQDWCMKYAFATLEAGRSWHPADRAPAGAAFLPMIEADETYHQLSAKARPVTTDAFSAHWSPDGKKLAFSMGVHGYSGVTLFDPVTRETELLIVPGKEPRWSPDGRYIAFVRDRQALRLEELATAERKDRGRWVKDEEVWVMNADGTEPRRLAAGGWPSWSQDSTCVYCQSRANDWLSSIPLAGGEAQPQQIARCANPYPSVSADNQRVAHVEGTLLKVNDLVSRAPVAAWPTPGQCLGRRQLVPHRLRALSGRLL